MPSISAPMAQRNRARSPTSGSQAAPSITVVPSASTAAQSTLAVPVTVEPNGPPRYISVPRSFTARASM
jgi:glucose dehydrogenase